MTRLTRSAFGLAFLLSIILVLIPAAALLTPAYGDDDAKAEIKIGRKAAAEVEKAHKLTADPQVVERVTKIGEAVAKVANSVEVKASYGSAEIKQFQYTFKVLDEEDVNAFSLPGGFVYVHEGLLDYVQSDHELAGVIAHEVAHASHHHMVRLLKEQSKLDSHIALVLLAGMLGNADTADLGNILIGAQLVRIARVSGYGQKAEADADSTAVAYMIKAGYNPVGLLTFMERLARDYATKPQVDMGIFQTHPPSRDRAREIVSRMKALGLPIKRREVTNAIKATAELVTSEGQPIMQVKLGNDILFEPAPIADKLTSQQRAEVIVTKVNQFLDSEPPLREIRLSRNRKAVLAAAEPVIVVTDEDAAFKKQPAEELAKQAAEVLKRVVWREWIERVYW